MRVTCPEALIGVPSTVVVVGALDASAGVGGPGWIAGLISGWGAVAVFAVARRRRGAAMGPADWVTLVRALLVAGVAALAAGPQPHGRVQLTLVVVSSIALVLDAVDGQVARRTATSSGLGARFDGEVDAYLILWLSVAVSTVYGPWVLAIGLVRYAFLVAGWGVPWLAATLPPRYWRKVVAAVQGIVLTVAVSGLLPRAVGMTAVAVAMVLLAESFGHDVLWLYRRGVGARARRIVRRVATVASVMLVWLMLVLPNQLNALAPLALLRIPIEGVVLVALALLLPPRVRRVVSIVAGVLIAVVAVVRLFDIGFYAEVGQQFQPVVDASLLVSAAGVLHDSLGDAAGTVIVVALLALVLLAFLIIRATRRIMATAAHHRRGSLYAVIAGGVIWALSAVTGLEFTFAAPVASASASILAAGQAHDAWVGIQDRERFAHEVNATDPYAKVPALDLLAHLRGKDVLIVFVESYGQVAVQGTRFSHGVDRVLRRGTAGLARAGFHARSAFLKSPTYGGISWLAHSTLQSGLWVDNQQRYNQLVSSDRFNLASAFAKAGWHTVSDIPSDDQTWLPGTSFYHYDTLYDRRNVGYHGPTFSYASMPDQFTLAAFRRHELTPGHRPVMAEIDLVSSHTPWTPLPHMVPWSKLGDGSIFDPMPAQGLTPDAAWRHASTVKRLYGQSIEYSLTALISWVKRLHDKNLVMVMLGDHQPSSTVSGTDSNHLVPTVVLAHDPAVLQRIQSWGWQPGLLPRPDAPVWPMDAFRNRFFDAFDR